MTGEVQQVIPANPREPGVLNVHPTQRQRLNQTVSLSNTSTNYFRHYKTPAGTRIEIFVST